MIDFSQLVFFPSTGHRQVHVREEQGAGNERRFRIYGKDRSVALSRDQSGSINRWMLVEGRMSNDNVLAISRAIDYQIENAQGKHDRWKTG